MASIELAAYRGVASVTITLNSLGATTGKAISSAIDNSSNLDLFDDLEVSLDFGTAPTVGTLMEVYLLPSIDGGTTYPAGDASTEAQSALYVGGFQVLNTAAIHVLVLRGIPLPPGLFKYLVKNTTNQALGAANNALRRNPWQLQST